MTRIVLDPASLAKLRDLKEGAEICDASGTLFGFFVPAEAPAPSEKVAVPFSDEDLDKFEQEPGGRPLREILADLEKSK